jgi:hypothetical protein
MELRKQKFGIDAVIFAYILTDSDSNVTTSPNGVQGISSKQTKKMNLSA